MCSLMYLSCILLSGVSSIHMLAMQSSAHLCSSFCISYKLCFYICPLLNCVRPMHALAMQNSACVFTHLLSSNCTSYFVPLHHLICAYCKCISLVVQQHSECILSDPGPIFHCLYIVMVQFVSLYFISPINV